MHVWSYAGRQYQGALEDLIGDGALKDADALVWDLRDGWGGAQPQYLDLFNPHSPTMKVTARNGETDLVDVKWRKPVAALINGGTRSGKEVLAYGFKEYRLGELIGSRTEGAVLAATAFLVGDEGLLLLAVEDVVVDGRRLEGAGSSRPSRSRRFPLRGRRRSAARPRRRGAGAQLGRNAVDLSVALHPPPASAAPIPQARLALPPHPALHVPLLRDAGRWTLHAELALTPIRRYAPPSPRRREKGRRPVDRRRSFRRCPVDS